MKKQFYILLGAALCCLLYSCGSDDNGLENDLKQQLSLIVSIAESETCTDSGAWRIVGLGAKPCGGPSGYIAYSININVENFLELVEDYNMDVRTLNEQKGLISDCAIEPEPSNVNCENGRAVLVFGENFEN